VGAGVEPQRVHTLWKGVGDVYLIPHRRLAYRQVGCSGEVAIVLAAVTFGGQKRYEAFSRFVTHKAVYSVSCPLQRCRQSILIDNTDERMKNTTCIVATPTCTRTYGLVQSSRPNSQK